jgi:hypothetical protein
MPMTGALVPLAACSSNQAGKTCSDGYMILLQHL